MCRHDSVLLAIVRVKVRGVGTRDLRVTHKTPQKSNTKEIQQPQYNDDKYSTTLRWH